MKFNVMSGSPSLAGNALLMGNRDATKRQSIQEHNALLDISTLPRYREVLAMPPGPQKSIAIAALKAEAELRESEFPKYWNDKVPRRQISQSSSFIGDVEVDPNTNMMMVQIGDKMYVKPSTPDQASDFVNSNSMGRYFNNVLKGR